MKRPKRGGPYHYVGRGNGKRYSAIRPYNKPIWHPDERWIQSKIKGQVGGYWLATNSKPSHIQVISTKKWPILFYYNCILFLRWFKRRLHKEGF